MTSGMKVFLLGATGTIGAPLLTELVGEGYRVTALARSEASAEAVTRAGAEVVRGDLRAPELWAGAIREADAVVHAAATFTEDMGEVDRLLVGAAAAGAPRRQRFVYTGGCWQYGPTGDHVATEETALDPIPAFAWMIENARRLAAADTFDLLGVHPAMVYVRDGGTFTRMTNEAREAGRVTVWGNAETRWPLVHGRDLARAYRLVLDHGRPGRDYNVAAEEGVPVGRIAAAIGARLGITAPPHVRPAPEVVAAEGDWALGPMLDQQMSADRIRRELGWEPEFTDFRAVVG